MAVSVSDLPPKYQAQILRKYLQQQGQVSPAAAAPSKGGKYHNHPTERETPSGGVIRFDSQKEARRYDYLSELEQAGQIHDLRLQVDFTLQEAYTDTEGRRVRAIRYRADFTYKAGEPLALVVEDVKSTATRTKEYLLKKKLLKDRLGIEITEV